ncbi:MAG: hypothetical protein IKP81_01500 [Paludibacteraceae bacterium]|jgi:hypothetical protein|nr:hypothetical protein [Paludibacteraceae bacterium]MBR6103716.1 hypothetical protein [Paludibacteraceae bacterium]
MNKDISKILDLKEGESIDLNLDGVAVKLRIGTEDSLTHGHGLPEQYYFPLSSEEKDMLIWLATGFKIENYKPEIKAFCKKYGGNVLDYNSFLENIRSLTIWIKTAKERPDFPDLTLYGSVGKSGKVVEYTLHFSHHHLVEIVNKWYPLLVDK